MSLQGSFKRSDRLNVSNFTRQRIPDWRKTGLHHSHTPMASAVACKDLKLQAAVSKILPSTTVVLSYAKGLSKFCLLPLSFWVTPKVSQNSAFYHCRFGLRQRSLKNCQLTDACAGRYSVVRSAADWVVPHWWSNQIWQCYKEWAGKLFSYLVGALSSVNQEGLY